MKKSIFGILLLALFAYLPVCEGGQTTVTKAYSDHVRRSDGMISTSSSDTYLDIASDREEDLHSINKFGHADAGVQSSATDMWDLADATPTQQIWVAPTSAQTHWIVSTSASDASGGVGARTVRLFGLIDWDLPEIIEDIVMNGLTSVTTTQSWVIIHRMKVLTKGATNVNVGAISAFATSDGTTTARILAGDGQTEMAIYGASSLCQIYVANYYGSINKAQGAAATINYSLLVNPEPQTELTNFVKKNTLGVQSTGTSLFSHPFRPYIKIGGPCIIKISGIANTSDVDGSAGFDLIRWTDTSGFDALITSNSSRRHNLDNRIITTSEGIDSRVIRTAQDISN